MSMNPKFHTFVEKLDIHQDLKKTILEGYSVIYEDLCSAAWALGALFDDNPKLAPVDNVYAHGAKFNRNKSDGDGKGKFRGIGKSNDVGAEQSSENVSDKASPTAKASTRSNPDGRRWHGKGRRGGKGKGKFSFPGSRKSKFGMFLNNIQPNKNLTESILSAVELLH